MLLLRRYLSDPLNMPAVDTARREKVQNDLDVFSNFLKNFLRGGTVALHHMPPSDCAAVV